MTMSSTVVKTEVTAEDCDPPSPLEGHLIMLPDSPLSDCDSQSFTTTGSCVTRCANDKPFQDISNKKSSTARELVSIIKQGRLEDLVYLLESKPNTDLNTFVNGNTALHYCLMLGRDVSWCKKLVSRGANPNLSNKDGWHPIHLAAYSGHPEILSYLVKCNTRTHV